MMEIHPVVKEQARPFVACQRIRDKLYCRT